MSVFHGNAVLALAAAVLWGIGDFAGGMGVKRSGGTVQAALRVICVSHATSLAVLLLILGLRRDSLSHGAPFAWAIFAGVAAGLSLTAFYVALSEGAMGASAAVSGLLAAALPAAVSSWLEGSPGTLRFVGFAVAGVAIWMIAAEPAGLDARSERRNLLLALIAGTGFGVYFIALRMAGAGGVVWPMALARVGSLTTCGLLLGFVLARRATWAGDARLTAGAMRWALLTAAGDTAGNLLFIAATRAGRLDIAAVLASLYPASTILLAGVLLKESPSRRQALGMAVAALAVVLVTL